MSHDVAEADDANKSARVRVVFAANDHEAVDPADLDQREDGAERVLRVASDNALEIRGTLLQCLLDREVERLVSSETNKSLSLAWQQLLSSQ